MSKTLYAYFNDEDLYDFFTFLATKDIPIFVSNGISLSKVHAIGTDMLTLYIPTCEPQNIVVSMCCYAGYFLQPGMIRLEDASNPHALSMFTAIKKYVRQIYKLSKDKTYYIGPSIYSDWLQGMHKFPVLFEYAETIVLEQDIKEVFTIISACGFVVRASDVRLRNINDWTINDETLVVCEDVSKLSRLIIRNTIVHYDYGSECIFVYKDVKRKQYKFVIDKRIDTVTHQKLYELFEKIRKLYEK